MKNFVKITVAAIFLGSVAHAGALDSTFGNTLTSTAADGSKIIWLYDADGKVAAKFPDGSIRSGLWTMDGTKLCLKFDGDLSPSCTEAVQDLSVGRAAQGTDLKGNKVTLLVTAGR